MTRLLIIAVVVLAISGCDARLGAVAVNPMTVAELVGTRLEDGVARDVAIEGIVWPNQHGDAVRDEDDPQQFVLMPWARGSEVDRGWRRYFDARMSTISSGGSMQIRVVAKGSLTRSGDTFYFRVSEFLKISVEPRSRRNLDSR